MFDRIEWMKPSDQIIVNEIGKYGGWLKPSSIYLNVTYTQPHVQRRCRTLYEHGLLERHETDAAYRLSDLGMKWLEGSLKPEDLE